MSAPIADDPPAGDETPTSGKWKDIPFDVQYGLAVRYGLVTDGETIRKKKLVGLLTNKFGDYGSRRTVKLVRRYLDSDEDPARRGSVDSSVSVNVQDKEVEQRPGTSDEISTREVFAFLRDSRDKGDKNVELLIQQNRELMAELAKSRSPSEHATSKPQNLSWDGLEPDAFVKQFEFSMRMRNIPHRMWKVHLYECLKGKALRIMSDLHDEEITYERMIQVLHESVGLSEEKHCQEFYSLTQDENESYSALASRLKNHFLLWVGPPSQAAYEKILIHRFMGMLPGHVYDFVLLKNPTTLKEAVSFATKKLGMHQSKHALEMGSSKDRSKSVRFGSRTRPSSSRDNRPLRTMTPQTVRPRTVR